MASEERAEKQPAVVPNESGGWSVLGHREVMEVLLDPDRFRSKVSAHLAIPSGLDLPEHAAYRPLINRFFTPERVAEMEPVYRRIVTRLWEALPAGEVELMSSFAAPYALEAQRAFVGWQEDMGQSLTDWLAGNQKATREGDREALQERAAEFETMVAAQLAWRRERDPEPRGDDAITRLMKEEVNGRPLSLPEITSILRNWTVGELGTMAASVGILARFLAHDLALQKELRERPDGIHYAIEEILRLQGPLWSNRRRVERDTRLGGCPLHAQERLTLMWAYANRDEKVFPQAETFRKDRDLRASLLYGAGPHVCPGAPLARLELRVALEVVLANSTVVLPGTRPSLPASPPASGWSEVWMRVEGSQLRRAEALSRPGSGQVPGSHDIVEPQHQGPRRPG